MARSPIDVRAAPVPWLGELLRMAVPATLGALIQSAIFFAEAGILARVGVEALAGVAVAFPLVMLTMMLSAGAVGGAVAGATARALGAGDRETASAVLLSALALSALLWAAFAAIVLLLGPAFFAWAGASGDALAGAVAYARTFFVGAILVWLFNMLCGVLRGGGDMARPALAIAVVLATYLAWMLLVFEPGPDLVGTLAAAARGVLVAYAVGLGVVALMLARPAQPVRLRGPQRHDLVVTRRVLRQGLLAGSQSLMTVGYSLVATALMARFGGAWLAGYGVAVRLELLLVPVIFGVGGALIALVGRRVGAGRRGEGVALAWRGAWLTMGLLTVIGWVVAVWPQLWCGPVSSGPAVAAGCQQALQTLGPFYGWFGLGLCLYFASQGLNTLVWPVLGAALRLVLVSFAVLLGPQAVDAPSDGLAWIAAAMTGYGVFVAAALWLGPWRTTRVAGVQVP